MSTHIKNVHKRTLPKFGLDIPVFTRLYDFYKELSQAVILFPKHKKYTLGQSLDRTTLKILRLLFSVSGNDKKTIVLKRMNLEIDLLKVLLRLSKDTGALPDKRYLDLSLGLHEIGKMTGGWIRYLKGL